ncbi:GAF domain-containing sensor histidine kinase [Hydrogenophaga sp.]|uniref:GAF domain-containing sensor histidine kinase n=1 Tax=Hydrogenophaga sp. TaxID=1904254 RepID=UPI00272200CB|nr:GAF domain-containing sensor histidine kinase [Hydrogenophaga sp.]MDO9433855.1 GAF domain-containing sensor histidine kinase [Hydrogenophaga sp.]
MDDSAESIARDIAAIGAISAVPSMLRIVCQSTGMGFAAVARVTAGTWTACAVQDNIAFGLKSGGQLPVHTTLCVEARAAREPVVFDHASLDPKYKDHHTPRMYNIESYISVPIVLAGGEYFGNLCAIDPHPRSISKAETVSMFTSFAELIAAQLEQERESQAVVATLLDERATSQLRENFIAVLGHDLRTPLATVAMTAEIMLRTVDNAQIAAQGQRLRTASKRMAKLVDDVLDLARGRLGGGIAMAKTPEEHLVQALEDVLDELRTVFPGRDIQRHFDIQGPVNCDRGRVQQLVSNLVSNALIYGSAEHPVVVRAERVGDTLEITVENRGEPIAREMQGKVFEPFWRPASSKPGAGLGLGLYISSEIAKGHGGGIELTSTRESGTRFVARLQT